MYLTAQTRRHGRGLRGLGAAPLGPTIVGAGGAIGGSIIGSGVGAFSSLGAAAGPIGAGVAVLVGIIATMWAQHDARAAGAKTENAAVNSAVQAFDASLKAVFQAANSGQVTGSQAAGVCQQIFQSYWQGMQPYMSGPGRADSSAGGSKCGDGTLNKAGPCKGTPGGHKCDKACTAGCCVGCQDLYPTILQAVQVFNSPTGGTVTACNVAGSSYGAVNRGSYSLTYTPPAVDSVAGVADALTSSSVGGIPLWVLLAAGGLAAYAASR